MASYDMASSASFGSKTETLKIPIGFTRPQMNVYRQMRRFNVLVTGRRFGKSIFGLHVGFIHILNVPRADVWYVAPTYRQAKMVAWKYILYLAEKTPLKHFVKSIDRTDLSVTLRNNSTLSLKGADKDSGLRGSGLVLVIIDEFSSMHEEVWSKVLRPTLSDKAGSAIIMGSPEGFDHLHKEYSKALDRYQANPLRSAWRAWQFTSLQGGWVTEEEVDDARATLDPRIFRQEYEASFESLTGRIYYNFEKAKNVIPDLSDPILGAELMVGMDFNVNPMSSFIGTRVGSQLHIIDDIAIPNSNTHEMCIEIKKRWGWSDNLLHQIEMNIKTTMDHPDKHHVISYPDPSGRSRKTSAVVGTTDFTIIHQHGFAINAPRIAPRRIDRFNTVNSLLCNAKGERNLLIHPRAKNVIKTFDGLVYKEGTNDPDIRSGLDHMGDAVGYCVVTEFPLFRKNPMEIIRR